jgi:hypothetical protein
MSTTSNSRADLRLAAAAMLLLAACATTPPAADPEAPRPALAATAQQPRPVATAPSDSDAPIEVDSATVRPAAQVPEVLARMRRSTDDASRLVVIDVTTSVDVVDQRSAYPVIVLDGRPLVDTLTLGPRRLAALVETNTLGRESSVAVTMIGDPTRASRRAVALRVP